MIALANTTNAGVKTIATIKPTITEREEAQVERANASGATPVVFIHGLWLLPSSWTSWVTHFEKAGYVRGEGGREGE